MARSVAPSTSTTSGSGGTARKIKIKAFARPPKLPPDYYDRTSSQLLKTTRRLLELQLSPSNKRCNSLQGVQLQQSHQQIVSLVKHQFGTRLYQDLVKELERACREQVLVSLSPSQDSDEQILKHVCQQFTLYVDYLCWLRQVYSGLDRPYVYEGGAAGVVVKRSSPQQPTLLEVGLGVFCQRLVELKWHDVLYQAWWRTLWKDWEGAASGIDDTTEDAIVWLRATMGLWADIGWKYRIVLESLQPDLTQSLQRVCQDAMTTVPYKPEAYLMYVWTQWHDVVSNRWAGFLPKTWVRRLVEVHLLLPHLTSDYLFQSMDLTNTSHFGRLVTLASRLEGGLQKVVDAVVQHGKAAGLALVEQPNGTFKVIVSGLLQLQEQLQTLSSSGSGSAASAGLTTAACGSPTSKKETAASTAATSAKPSAPNTNPNNTLIPLKAIFSEVLNVDPTKVAEFLAKYVDMCLRNHKIPPPLEELLKLFRFLQAKDVFEAFYKRDLAKRLLNSKVVSMDMERQFVSMLKVECGAGYTSKMEGMFQDVEWSRESMARYKSSNDYYQMKGGDVGAAANSVEMEVQILTTGYWPVYPQYPNLILPPALLANQTAFWEHYKAKYQGRKIVWQYSLGQCVVKFTSGKKCYDLILSLAPALILLAMNQDDDEGKKKTNGWTLGELAQLIGLEDKRDEMERFLQSLSLGKEGTRVLKRVSAPTSASSGNIAPTKPSSSIADTDTFVVNERFTSQHRRIRIPNILFKDTKEDRNKVVEGVSRDRLYLIDAVLVRILKARKTITHQQLIPQVLDQVKVPAQPSDVKKRIESLIEREYMERDKSDRTRYNYLA